MLQFCNRMWYWIKQPVVSNTVSNLYYTPAHKLADMSHEGKTDKGKGKSHDNIHRQEVGTKKNRKSQDIVMGQNWINYNLIMLPGHDMEAPGHLSWDVPLGGGRWEETAYNREITLEEQEEVSRVMEGWVSTLTAALTTWTQIKCHWLDGLKK